MKWLSKQIDIFCLKHPRFGISNLMIFIVIGNAAVWLFSMMDTSYTLVGLLAFNPELILQGQVWRLVSFIFVTRTEGLLALVFFYFYYFIGNTLESRWGIARFNLYFFSGVILTIIYGFLLYFITGKSAPVYAVYIYFSMFFSFATLFPDTQVMLFFCIPIKVKWLGLVNAIYFLLSIFAPLPYFLGGFRDYYPLPLDLLPLVAVLNYFFFCGSELIHDFRPRAREKRNAAVNFKREINRIRYEERTKAYSRRCEVCGRTDADHPDLEFRFCSRCAGYHCYCIDHINAHRHFTE